MAAFLLGPGHQKAHTYNFDLSHLAHPGGYRTSFAAE